MARITYDDIMNAIHAQTELLKLGNSKTDATNDRLDKIEEHLRTLNGRVNTACSDIRLLQDHDEQQQMQIGTLQSREREASITQAKSAGIWGFLAGLIPAVLQWISTHQIH